ncbi:L,D-transpeptidase family protein [Allosphingosinicella sp.]|uniref:L,D-transpeptidase family protein n=1 Tax=Allosphingosinicella sp. TaxID=2823234 RepID=UPI002FC1637F
MLETVWMAREGTVRGWKLVAALACFAATAACSQELPMAASGLAGPAVAATQNPASSPAVEAPVALAASDPSAPAPELLAAPSTPASAFAVNTVLALDYPLQPNDYVWDEEGAPDGPIGVVIDLTAQRLYVYRAGVEIGRSVIIYGADDKPTPTGTFPILEKDIDHVSNLYDGAPMPYMLRLTWDGVAIHGSGEIGYEWATHGCIGLPDEFAAILYEEAGLGDQVLVTEGWMTDYYEA